jgi:hypothetical protein
MIIDVINNPRYLRWLKKGKKFILTEVTSANCIRSSDKKEIYYVDSMPDFSGVENYKKVQMVEIDKDEYDYLCSLTIQENPIPVDSQDNELDDPVVLKQRVNELQNEVEMLTNCILEMSTIIYS